MRRWRILAKNFLSNKNTYSFLPAVPEMPTEKDFSIKELCALYVLLHRRLKSRAPKLNRQEDKKLAEQLELYKRDFFSDNFGDGGYLARMKKILGYYCEAEGGRTTRQIHSAMMGGHLHSSTTRPYTASWECSSGWTFGSQILILGTSVEFSVPLTGLQLMQWLKENSSCTQNLDSSALYLPWLT